MVKQTMSNKYWCKTFPSFLIYFRPKSTSFKVFFWKLQVPRKPNRNIQQQLPPHQPWQPNKIFGQKKNHRQKNLLSFWSHICAIFVIFSITKYTSIYYINNSWKVFVLMILWHSDNKIVIFAKIGGHRYNSLFQANLVNH